MFTNKVLFVTMICRQTGQHLSDATT